MNASSNHTASSSNYTSLFQDRPLDSASDAPAPYSLTAPVEGEGWEVALRTLLVLCLVASMMVFGFSVSTASPSTGANPGAAPAMAVKALDHTTPVAFPVAACQKTAALATNTL